MTRTPPDRLRNRIPDRCVRWSLWLCGLLLVVGTAAVFFAALLVPFTG